MSARKPLDEGCNGSIDCPVAGHVLIRPNHGSGHIIQHVALTLGQRKTLRERRNMRSRADTSINLSKEEDSHA